MEKFRSKILACFLAFALVVLTTPICLNFDTRKNSIEIQSNKAHAVVPVAGAAAAFLAEIAAASGLTVGEFVATVAGITTIGTGMAIATDAGINYGNDASVNLGNLIDAADYPAWDSLTQEQQEAWGTREYYDSAKFNSLLDAFDLGDARERFYSSAGGNIDYTSSETATLEKIGSIGANWINNGSNTITSLLDSMRPTYLQDVSNYVGHSTFKNVIGSDIEGWPSTAPESMYVNIGDYLLVTRYYSGTNKNWYYQVQASDDVYFIIYSGPQYYTYVFMFSKSGFSYGYNYKTLGVNDPLVLDSVNVNSQAETRTYQDKTYYYKTIAISQGGYSFKECNMAYNTSSNNPTNYVNQVIPLILFNDDITGSLQGITPDIVGYPEDIQEQGDTNIYFPSVGIVPGTDWNDYETAPDTPPIIDEEVDLTEIIQLLQRFHFTVDYNLLVQDNPLRSAVMELVSIMNKFTFYAGTGQLKVHDEGVFDSIGDMGSYLGGLLQQIQTTLSGFFVTDTATDVIGDLDFPDLGDKAIDLVDTISTLAPFGAMFLISELVAILSQVGKIQTPSMVFDFNFMPEHEYNLTVDLSWLNDVKPLINFACILTLIVGLAGTTARLIELEAAA